MNDFTYIIMLDQVPCLPALLPQFLLIWIMALGPDMVLSSLWPLHGSATASLLALSPGSAWVLTLGPVGAADATATVWDHWYGEQAVGVKVLGERGGGSGCLTPPWPVSLVMPTSLLRLSQLQWWGEIILRWPPNNYILYMGNYNKIINLPFVESNYLGVTFNLKPSWIWVNTVLWVNMLSPRGGVEPTPQRSSITSFNFKPTVLLLSSCINRVKNNCDPEGYALPFLPGMREHSPWQALRASILVQKINFST